jgi:cytosine permease
MPAILMLAMIPSIVMQQRDLILIMTTLGLGIPALTLLVVKAWATNSGNLYVAALSAANFLSNHRQKYIVAGAGPLGTMVAVMGIADRLVPFLLALGVSIPPVAGIYVADHWMNGSRMNRGDVPVRLNRLAFACWIFGICAALAARFDLLTLSGVSAIDSMLAAAAGYAICRRIWP